MAFGAKAAVALEVPADAQEVRVPVTLTTNTAIAGGEVELTMTEGLTFVDFLPASGINNKMQTQVSGKQYVGFFAADNQYAPVNGTILIGHVVFAYTGTEPQEVYFSEVRLHTKVTAEKVDSSIYNPNTTVRITRPATEDNPSSGTGENNGNTGTGTNTGTNTGTGTTGTNTATGNSGTGYTQTVQLPGASPASPVVIDRTVGDTDDTAALQPSTGETTDTTTGSQSSGTSGIQDATTPLSAGDTATQATAFNPMLLLMAGFLVLAAALFLFFLFRRRKHQEEPKRTH
jgi:hypothetical protein